jgi:hypothetical protein
VNRLGEFKMRRTGLFAIAAALILAGVGGWAASNTQARVAPEANVQIDPLQLMTHAGDLPAQHYQDFSLVFN